MRQKAVGDAPSTARTAARRDGGVGHRDDRAPRPDTAGQPVRHALGQRDEGFAAMSGEGRVGDPGGRRVGIRRRDGGERRAAPASDVEFAEVGVRIGR